jgi:2-(1,2-epoxy-1,2-dihydrophenyl)acetyl-CoA isomerase
MSEELGSRPEGAIHWLTLNRPARRNALTPDLARTLSSEIDRVAGLGRAEAVVPTGAGGHFCAGLDLHWLRSLGSEPSMGDLQQGLGDFQSAVLAVTRCPLPVIAAVAGTVAGFGFDLALACDFRIAAADATFTSAFARMGLVPDGGSTYTLPRLVGAGRALRILLAGETLDAARAQALGILDQVVQASDLEDAIHRLVAVLSASAASSVRTIKQLLRNREPASLEEALAAEGAAQVRLLREPEFRRRLEAFAARPSPSGEET